MPLNNGIHSFIHSASTVTSAFTYTQVYAAGTNTFNLNGTEITMAAGDKLDVLVRNIAPLGTGGTLNGIYVLGDKVNTSDPGGTVGVIL